jgi:hypothetical protein
MKPLEAFYKAKGARDGYRTECKFCNNQQKHDRYMADPEREKVRVKNWQQENRQQVNAYRREYRSRPEVKAADRAGHLKRKFQLTPEEYEAKLRWQRGVCLICQQPPAEGKMLDVDHDHQTGQVRGLLCRNCNHGLGKFYENPFLLAAAAGYLVMWDDPEPKEFPRVRLAIGGEPREPREDRLAG